VKAGREVSPPRLATWLVSRALPVGGRDAVLGDLHERYVCRVTDGGAAGADRWYWKQALSFVIRVPVSRAAARFAGRGRSIAVEPSRRGVGLGSEIRFAARALRKRPGLSVTAVAVLALAVGANTTVFSVVKAVLLDRLPYPEPDRLVMLWDVFPDRAPAGRQHPVAWSHVREWSARTDVFEGVGAFESTSPALLHGEWPERIEGAMVSVGLLDLLGAQPVLGRLLEAQDAAPGAEPVVVLSHGLWRSRFGGDPGIVGRRIDLGGEQTRVVGVTADRFWFYDPWTVYRSVSGRSAEAARLWQPIPDAGPYGGETDYPRYRVIARLRDGVSVSAAVAAAVAARPHLPVTEAGDGASVRLVPLSEQVVTEARPRLLGMSGAVSLVLLIACVNLISLLLVNVESRRSEFAIRAALGAGRGRLSRQLILESTMLALAGGLAGLLVAGVATGWLLDLVPRGLPLAHRVALDAPVAVFGIGLALLAGLVVGGAAAMRIDTASSSGLIRSAQRSVSRGRGGRRLHGSLVAAEVALSLVLLIGATLLLKSFVALRAIDTGFDARGVLTFDATLATPAGAEPDYAFFTRLETDLRELPGVRAVGSTTALPFSRWMQVAGIEIGDPVTETTVSRRTVSPGYFDAIGLAPVAGRAIEATDRVGAPPVVVINRAFVERWFGDGGDPLGRTVTIVFRDERTVHTVVGVVPNVKHDRLLEDDQPILYVPLLQSPFVFQRFAVRTAGLDPMTLAEPIRRIAASIDPDQPLTDFIDFEALVAQSIEEETFYTQILGSFAIVALVLTLVGIYGVVAWVTRQRDREVGIRMALGAAAGSVRRLVLGQGLLPVGVGLAIGWLASLAATGVLRGLLHGVPEHDIASYLLATAIFALVAAAACMVPAVRASRLDPVRVIRDG
jgi:putative ABC transport system permease protein